MPSSTGSSWPRIKPACPVSLHRRWILYRWATREAPQIVGDLAQNKTQRKETLGNLQPRVRREEPYCFLSPFPSGLFLEGMVSCIKLSSGAFYLDRTNKILSKWCLLHIWLSPTPHFFLTLKSDQLLFYWNILCILIHWVITFKSCILSLSSIVLISVHVCMHAELL